MNENKHNAMLYQHFSDSEGLEVNYNFYFNIGDNLNYYKQLQKENPSSWAGYSFIKDLYIKRD